LRAFEASARCQSFTKAAAELNVTASAISQQVRQLENLLGHPLFERLVNGLAVTDEGNRFLPFVRAAFRNLNDGLTALEDPDLPRKLNLVVISSLSATWLAPRLGQFTEMNPNIAISLFHDHEPPDFQAQNIDLAILWGDGHWKDCDCYFLMGEKVFPVCSPAYAETLPDRIDAAAGEVVLLASDTHSEWPTWLDAVGASINSFPRIHTYDDGALTIDAAERGLGIALARSCLAFNGLKTGKLVIPYPTILDSASCYYMVVGPRETPNPVIDIFMAWAGKCAHQFLAEEKKLLAKLTGATG